MIRTRKDVSEVLGDYTTTQYEWIHKFWVGDAEEWGDMASTYSNGIVLGKFREGHLGTMELLKNGVTNDALYDEICLYIKYNIEDYRRLEQPDIMDEMLFESNRKQLSDLQSYSIDEWIDNNCSWIKEYAIKNTYTEIRVLVYLYYTFYNFEYERKHPYNNDVDMLSKVYRDVLDKQSQFHKYGILSIDEDRELMVLDPPRVYDKRINKSFFIKNVPLCLLQQIYALMSNGQIGKFAVRLQNAPGYDGKIDGEYLEEALERGKIFEFSNLGTYSVSKLYCETYEDCLWINIAPCEITFEELCEDFTVYKDMIITQVIHLEYDTRTDATYITHLDHEYIFYDVDEYEKRLTDVAQKGAARTRMKSFKIDDAKIPFDTRCIVFPKDEKGNNLPSERVQFLCYVLECYFKHKDLLKEYFQNM